MRKVDKDTYRHGWTIVRDHNVGMWRLWFPDAAEGSRYTIGVASLQVAKAYIAAKEEELMARAVAVYLKTDGAQQPCFASSDVNSWAGGPIEVILLNANGQLAQYSYDSAADRLERAPDVEFISELEDISGYVQGRLF